MATHPEAADWAARVIANGGSVSATTLAAVDTFCRAIDAAGIRDRFYRLNLFCGTGLSACLVPLYRGPSPSGTQAGGSTDTNVNFVAGDYAETGASGGLLGNGSSKYLNTGFSTNDLDTAATAHLSVYMRQRTEVVGSFRVAIGMFRASGETAGQEYAISTSGVPVPASRHSYYWANVAANYDFVGASLITPANLYTISRTSTSLVTYYGGATSLSTNTSTVSPPQTAKPFWVFAANFTSPFHFNSRLGGYSIGRSLTGSQVAAYSSAMAVFQTTLGRNA